MSFTSLPLKTKTDKKGTPAAYAPPLNTTAVWAESILKDLNILALEFSMPI